MMGWLGATLLAIGFISLVRIFRLVDHSKRVTKLAHRALSTIRDSRLNDDQKATRLQVTSRRLFGLFFLLTTCAATALALPLGGLLALAGCGWFRIDEVLSTVASLGFVVASMAIMLLVAAFHKRFRHGVDEQKAFRMHGSANEAR